MTLRESTKALQRNLNELLGIGLAVDGIWGPNTAAAALYLSLEPGSVLLPDPNDQPFDARTEKNLATLQPGAARIFRPFLRRAVAIAATFGADCKVISGLRDRATQEAYKASGASKAGYGYSWHNYGTAVDLGLFKGSTYLDALNQNLAWTVYGAIAELAPEFKLEWGGSWTSIADTPHFHVDQGRSTPNAADRRRLHAGTYTYP